ncbi:MAG: hypothetical protein ACLPX7_27235 [Xanthobacteraceae bacterium]
MVFQILLDSVVVEQRVVYVEQEDNPMRRCHSEPRQQYALLRITGAFAPETTDTSPKGSRQMREAHVDLIANPSLNDLILAKLPWRQHEIAFREAFPQTVDLLLVDVGAAAPEAAEGGIGDSNLRMSSLNRPLKCRLNFLSFRNVS